MVVRGIVIMRRGIRKERTAKRHCFSLPYPPQTSRRKNPQKPSVVNAADGELTR